MRSGGWPTAVISTYGLRHKCAKPSFLIKMYVAIALQLGGVAAMVHHMHEHPDALIELVRAANIPHSAFVCTFDAKAFCV